VPDETETVVIESLGHRGDGIVTRPDGPLYVPFTLPGERVKIEREGKRGRVIGIDQPVAGRVQPICRHFSRCGGCALQMMTLDATRELKRAFVATALAQRGVSHPVDATIGVPVASRRRAVLTALKAGRHALLGYHERLSHRLVDVEECPILLPALQARLPAIRALAEPLIRHRKPVRMTVLYTSAGLDVNIGDIPAPDPTMLADLASLCSAAAVARLSLSGDPLLTLAEPVLDISDVTVVPPPGGFVQASAEAERAIVGLITSHLSGARSAADLFAGIGTFALALAAGVAVHAVEASHPALITLQQASHRARRLKAITTEQRDLFSHPLSPAELGRFDAVVLDPPFAGARSQAEVLAKSAVKRVAMVSCNPATFARDARILSDGGYGIDQVVPVDQFVYSAEVEVVGLFSRG
jgi:23S rRNA (uracil1939-C5)-methyltransferase